MISINTADIAAMLSTKELEKAVKEVSQDLATDIFVELTAPPPTGTPVDTGAARDSWQIDLSIEAAPEVYSTSPYMNRLNNGHSDQSPSGFIDAAVDRILNK